LLFCLLSACGGVTQPLGDAPGTSGATIASSHPCEKACVLELFNDIPTGCKLCHDDRDEPEGLRSSGLALAGPGVTARLKDVTAQHGDLASPADSDCPSDDKLIDTESVERSWLLRKIRGQQGTCGDAMPPVPPFEAKDRQCLETYVYCVAAN
jgi:hypothetical protein